MNKFAGDMRRFSTSDDVVPKKMGSVDIWGKKDASKMKCTNQITASI